MPRLLAAACEGEIARSNQDTEEVQGDASTTTATGGEDSSSGRSRNHRILKWRQVSVLEQVLRRTRSLVGCGPPQTTGDGLRTHLAPPLRRRPCIQLSPTAGPLPRCVQVWFKTGGRNGSRNSKRSGTTRPRSGRLIPAQLLEELLPHASSADAQRVFAQATSRQHAREPAHGLAGARARPEPKRGRGRGWRGSPWPR